MRYFSNAAVETELATICTLTATQINVLNTTGYPAQLPFTILAAPDAATEEIMLVTARNGNSWEVVRGFGGTAAIEHKAGTKIRHGAVAEDFREGALAYHHLFGDPQYDPADPTAPPTNPPLVAIGDIVTKAKDTWADLLPSNYVSPIPQPQPQIQAPVVTP